MTIHLTPSVPGLTFTHFSPFRGRCSNPKRGVSTAGVQTAKEVLAQVLALLATMKQPETVNKEKNIMK
jgi:hypothetical protein